MKKLLLLAAAVTGFFFIAAPTAVESQQVLLNGKPFANAVNLNGNLYIPIADLARAAGGGATLEPGFRLQGSTLIAVAPSAAPAAPKGVPGTFQHKHIAGVKYEDVTVQCHVQKTGEISSHVIMKDGKALVPLSDVARAFGIAGFTGPITRSGQSISLNFTVNSNAILGN